MHGNFTNYTIKLIATGLILTALFIIPVNHATARAQLDPSTLTKWLDTLVILPVMQPKSVNYYEIGAYQITQKLHSQLPPTTVWGYGTSPETAHYPGYTIETQRGVPIKVKWTNNLVDEQGMPLPHLFTVDQTIHWANPYDSAMTLNKYTGPVPIVTHLHGAETEPSSDGYPTAWYTPGFEKKGPGWKKEIYDYPNTQPPTTLWYHDHALGMTRLNVYAGLSGFYILRDPQDTIAPKLPSGSYEIPLVIQDRMFNDDGSLAFPDEGVNAGIHPFWMPEFFGNVILVNGVIWPRLDVEPRRYRFRLLNGSNARFYELSFSNGMQFHQIGVDGGYLPRTADSELLLLSPAERADVIVDFSGLPQGTTLYLYNDARIPFPNGESDDTSTTFQIMQIRVNKPLSGEDLSIIPGFMRNISINDIVSNTRTITLVELSGDDGPLGALIDGKMFENEASETPQLGSTEIWKIVNLTEDAHPIHMHLVQFLLLGRQPIEAEEYLEVFEEANPVIPVPMDGQINTIPVEPYLVDTLRGPNDNEKGFKDTYHVLPGEVTTFLVKFAPQEADTFAFDPTESPGYVFHCHILDHEDNEMMRPYMVVDDDSTQSDVAVEPEIQGFSLGQNFPNPAGDFTNITYTLTREDRVSLSVYDMLGNRVMTAFDEVRPQGTHRATLNTSALAAGVYTCRLSSGEKSDSRIIMVLR